MKKKMFLYLRSIRNPLHRLNMAAYRFLFVLRVKSTPTMSMLWQWRVFWLDKSLCDLNGGGWVQVLGWVIIWKSVDRRFPKLVCIFRDEGIAGSDFNRVISVLKEPLKIDIDFGYLHKISLRPKTKPSDWLNITVFRMFFFFFCLFELFWGVEHFCSDSRALDCEISGTMHNFAKWIRLKCFVSLYVW